MVWPVKNFKALVRRHYEILDALRRTKKAVHFDRLKHASIKHFKDELSDIEADSDSGSDSDSHFETVVAPRKKLYTRRAPAPQVADNVQPDRNNGVAPAQAPIPVPRVHIQAREPAIPANVSVEKAAAKPIKP